VKESYLLESTFSDKALVIVLWSSSPSDVVSVVVCFSDFLFFFVPDLHTIVKDKDIDGTTLALVPICQKIEPKKAKRPT
jgi:hypothetical protein